MKKYVLQEFMNLDYSNDLLTEEEREGNQRGIHLVLAGKIQAAGKKNGNGRIYPKPILEREMKNYTKLVKEGRAIGELDHPDSSVVELKNASHLITEVWWDGDDVMGKMKILDTPAGKIAKDLVKGEPHPDEDENVEVVVLPFETVVGMVRGGEIRDGKSIAGLLMAWDRLHS